VENEEFAIFNAYRYLLVAISWKQYWKTLIMNSYVISHTHCQWPWLTFLVTEKSAVEW